MDYQKVAEKTEQELAILKKDYKNLLDIQKATETYLNGASEALVYAQEKSERFQTELTELKKDARIVANMIHALRRVEVWANKSEVIAAAERILEATKGLNK